MIDKKSIDKNIDSLADIAKNVVDIVYPFYYGASLYNDYIQRLKRIRKQKETILIKYYTLGLTYFEKQRLKELY